VPTTFDGLNDLRLGFDKPPLHASVLTVTAQVVDVDVSATRSIPFDKETTLKTAQQHTFSLVNSKSIFRKAAFFAATRIGDHGNLCHRL
jgi:hypothetical protein